MKKVVLILVLLLANMNSFAFNNNQFPNENVTLELKVTSEAETTNVVLNFSSIEDFIEFNVNQLNFDDNVCPCTVNISVTVSVGVDSTYVSVTMTANNVPCNEVAATISQLKAQAKKALGIK